jgi:circadian clock protein KaiC
MSITKLPTEIHGFDLIALGGLPEGRTTLVAGSSGSAKTVFAAQFLAAGITERAEPGVFVTFEETPDDLRRNFKGLGWDIASWEADGLWSFVDVSPEPGEPQVFAGGYDLGGLMARVQHAVKKVGARRLVLDAIGAYFGQFPDEHTVRSELFRLTRSLRTLNVTSLITAERGDEYGSVSRFGVEEYVSDNVMILRNVLDEEVRRRTL